MDPKASLARVRHDGIERLVDGLGVDAGDGDRRPDQIRSPRPPVPKNGIPGTISARSRNSSSLYEAPVHSSRRRPGTATSPFSSCSVASACSSTSNASGAAPRTARCASGRQAFSPGRSRPPSRGARWSESGRRTKATHVRDHHRVGGEQLRLSGGNVVNTLPISSCPSITSLIPTGGFPPQARKAPTWTRMFDFESAAPRRRSRRRARSPRTAAIPTSTRRRQGRRRSGRRGAPSELRRERGSRLITGAVSGSSSSSTSTPIAQQPDDEVVRVEQGLTRLGEAWPPTRKGSRQAARAPLRAAASVRSRGALAQ